MIRPSSATRASISSALLWRGEAYLEHHHKLVSMAVRASVDADTATDAVLLRLDRNVFHHGALGVIRSLGRLGVRAHAMREDRFAPAGSSRYARRTMSPMPPRADPDDVL